MEEGAVWAEAAEGRVLVRFEIADARTADTPSRTSLVCRVSIRDVRNAEQ